MSEREEWREVEKCPLYEISNRGRIRKLNYKAHYLNNWGYPTVQLWKGNACYKALTIHRLVAEAFIPNPQNLPEVNHKDGNKQNFQPENLEWVSRLENRRHGARLGLFQMAYGEKHGRAKLTDANVREIHSLAGSMGQREIAKRFSVSQYTISAILRGLTWTHIPMAPREKMRTNFGDYRGEKSPRAKLNESQVREIRALSQTTSQKEIAKRFDVSTTAVGCIIRRRTWAHI